MIACLYAKRKHDTMRRDVILTQYDVIIALFARRDAYPNTPNLQLTIGWKVPLNLSTKSQKHRVWDVVMMWPPEKYFRILINSNVIRKGWHHEYLWWKIYRHTSKQNILFIYLCLMTPLYQYWLTWNGWNKPNYLNSMNNNAHTQRTHQVIITPLWRQNDVVTSFRLNNGVFITPCARWMRIFASLNVLNLLYDIWMVLFSLSQIANPHRVDIE